MIPPLKIIPKRSPFRRAAGSVLWILFVCGLALWLFLTLSTAVRISGSSSSKSNNNNSLIVPVKGEERAAARLSRSNDNNNNKSNEKSSPQLPAAARPKTTTTKTPTPTEVHYPWTVASNFTGTFVGKHETVLVLVPQPTGCSLDTLATTVTDALSSPQAIVLVATSTLASFDGVQQRFSAEIERGNLMAVDASYFSSLVLSEGDSTAIHEGSSKSPDLMDAMNMAYLLELAAPQHQVLKFNFTLVLQGGMRLQQQNHTLLRSTIPYTAIAVEQYRAIEEYRRQSKKVQRTCYTILSKQNNNANNLYSMEAFMFDTAEHASRMSMMLRSILPYRTRHLKQILDYYCRWTLWEGQKVVGPEIFQNSRAAIAQQSAALLSLPTPSPLFLNASHFPLPSWIDPSVPVGPFLFGTAPIYTIIFGVTTMSRPGAGNDYLVQFMKELLPIVESEFMFPQQQAVIVLLLSGDSSQEIASLRLFAEREYGSSIASGVVRLVDSPYLSYATKLQSLRLTFPAERPLRRYWRSKQNLDIAATLDAAAGLSSYVMLLEDDTGFQPGFAASLKAEMRLNEKFPLGIPTWSAAEFGFGYSGVLIHASDTFVFQQIHATFFDERPCDLFKIENLIRGGYLRKVQSRSMFANKKRSFLKHNGKMSTLDGKQQPVW